MSDFSEEERRGVYRAIYGRRDVRSQFISDQIGDEVLARLLSAAHHAPSVGFMQPSEFIIIRDEQVRRSIYENFSMANRTAAGTYEAGQRDLYDNLKLEGILQAPINICVTCDQDTVRGFGLGRKTMPETALYSTVCAVQNLWLAARAEGIGVGWVSILDTDKLRATLTIPAHVVPVAYLCVGYVSEFSPHPDLEIKGWQQRVELADLIHFDRYGNVDRIRARQLLSAAASDALVCPEP
jgi:5,6-dimethylbenzimidazole synthase